MSDGDTLPKKGEPYPTGSKESQPSESLPKARLKDRLTVVSNIYYQRVGKNPKSIPSKFARDLESKQQLYERELEATEEWQPLDCGWVTYAGMLVIINHEGQNLQVHPTDEERKATAKKIIELAWGKTIDNESMFFTTEDQSPYMWLVPPGESFQGFPSNPSQLCIRSQSGVAEYTLYLIPR